MRKWREGAFWAVWMLLALVALSGCGDAQQEAMRELHRRDLGFTVGDFMAAAGKGDLAAVQIYLAAGMGVDSPDEAGTNALMKASESGQADVIAWLVENGADPNRPGGNGRTPLIAAAQGGHDEIIRLLLREGAEPAATDDDDWSALTLASYRGHAGAVSLLAPHSLELLDDALLIAAFEGDPEVIDTLIAHGAYVNARSPNNQTALMIAAMNGKFDAVKLLLHNGANRYALDDAEMTAANLAIQSDYAEVSDFLNQPPPISGPDEYSEFGAGAAEEWVLPEEVFVPGGFTAVEEGSIPETSRKPSPAPPSRAQGIQIHHEADAGEDLVANFRMEAYREESLPVILKAVEEEAAEVRVLYRDADPVVVKEGDLIADTGLEVISFGKRFANSKHGKGSLVDVSQMIVADRETGAKHLLVKGLPAKSSETFAVMRLDGSGRSYDVRTQDEFTAEGATSREHYRVVDVRPNQVVIENTGTKESITIPRLTGLGTLR